MRCVFIEKVVVVGMLSLFVRDYRPVLVRSMGREVLLVVGRCYSSRGCV